MNASEKKLMKNLQKSLKVIGDEYKRIVELCNQHKEIFTALADRAEQLEVLNKVGKPFIKGIC